MGKAQKGSAGTDALNKAVDAYKLCLTERTQDNDPRDWALTQYNLGLVLTEIGTRGKDKDAWNDATTGVQRGARVLHRRTMRRPTGPIARKASAGRSPTTAR